MSSKPIVECVPNISEGRDRAKIDRIVSVVSKVPGVKLLDVDPNGDYNRCVITYAGEPDACVDATFRLVAAASDEIDMTVHHGEHPRSGAVDVAPFVPVRGITMAECAELSRKLGQRVGSELDIPVFLYEAAASRPSRSNLAKVRKGEYEALPEKMSDPEWVPDFGPHKFVPKFGCLITGARFFLVAYNVNLRTSDVDTAHDIALHIRQLGWPQKSSDGTTYVNALGKNVLHPGPLQNCKAMGVYLEESKFSQVSINLTNYLISSPHIAYEQTKVEASARGIEVFGSEVVGLIPLEAVLLAAEYYVWKEKLSKPKSEREAVELAEDRLGLSSFNKFESSKKIIEYAIAEQ
ncbi:MAG: glutamate formimidoyltransferase [Calditrichaeota bacterium]|nr:glutamate formimidoyltransferase [Calditrichota bacterium]MCB9391926.1 glutamate formimidoyltransferase [Calditrichota bacterium]